MLTPGWHNDTYAEEYHRAFFQNYAGGKPLASCGTKDYHIGALSMIPGLLAGLEATGTTLPAAQLESVLSLVRSTHNHPDSLRAATDLTRILSALAGGASIRDTISQLSLPGVSIKKLLKWESFEDRKVVGNTLSTACYLPESFLAHISHGNTMTTSPLRYWQMPGWAATIVTAAWFSDPSSHAVTECPIGGWMDYWLLSKLLPCNFAKAVLRF